MKRPNFVSAIMIAFLWPACTQAEILYEVIDLGTLGGDWSYATSINDAGQIVGWAVNSEGRSRATLFDPTGIGNNIDLGTLADYQSSWAAAINNSGQIVGRAWNSEEDMRATLFDPTGDGNNIDLGTLGGDWSEAYSINGAGQIVGRAKNDQDWTRATLFDPTGNGNNIDLGTLGGAWSEALSINEAGQIVGRAASRQVVGATLFDPTGAGNNIDLGTLGGIMSDARSINDAGQIVGWALPYGNYPGVAALFDPTGAGNNVSLGTLGGDQSWAWSINDASQIVGAAEISQDNLRATLFNATGAGNNIDLNTLIDPASGWTLLCAYDINASGWIVGDGFNPQGEHHAFLLIPVYTKYSGGMGEPNDPYQIATAEDLMLLGESPEDCDKHFILTADIDLDPNLPGRRVFDKAVIGEDWLGFTGVFDGNDHKISHLTIKGVDYLGLFSQLGLLLPVGEVTNLGVVDVNITGSGDHIGGIVGEIHSGSITECYSIGIVTGNQHVGGLVGYNEEGSVYNCYSNGTITGVYRVGGLVGSNDDGSVSNCYSTSMVNGEENVGGLAGCSDDSVSNSYSTGTVTGDYNIGGLVGYNEEDSNVSNCYSTSMVNGEENVGGLAGYNEEGSISNSYSTGTVEGDYRVGGLVGYNNEGSVSNSFWDTQTSSQTTSAGGTGKTTAEMQTASTFLDAGWDFINVWGIGEGQTYPYLRKYSAADINRDEGVNFDDLAILAENWLADIGP
jgi:probable HAF family extracellular repeat protein